MHQSAFINYLNTEARGIPAAVVLQVKREARARIVERLQAGRADCELTFTDLFDRCEAARLR